MAVTHRFRFALIGALVLVSLVQARNVITLDVEGGSRAGSYELRWEDILCGYGQGSGDDVLVWGAFQDFHDADADIAFVLRIPSIGELSKGGHAFLAIGFGDMEGEDDDLEYTLDPASGLGTSTVTLRWDGQPPMHIDVIGTTAGGVGLKASVTCNSIIAMTGEDVELWGDFPVPSETDDAALPSAESGIYTFETGPEETFCAALIGPDLHVSYEPRRNRSVLNLYIPNLEEALTGTSTFALGLYDQSIHGAGDGSEGRLHLTREGELLTITVAATSVRGVAVQATLRCVHAE